MNKALICLGLLVFSGCSLVPGYERPQAPIPDLLPVSGSNGAQTVKQQKQTFEILQWKNFYKNQELKNLIGMGLKNNRDFRAAALSVEQARAAYGVQKSDLLPTVGADGEFRRQKIPPNALLFGGGGFQGAGGNEGFTQTQAGLSAGFASYELDFFGRLRSLNESALEEFFATEYAKHNAKIALISEIASAYLRLLADRKLARIAKETMTLQEEAVSITRMRFKSGVSSELDYQQALRALENAKAEHSEFERRVSLDKNALEVLIGTSLDLKNIKGKFGSAGKAMRALKVSLSSAALLRRPDIKRAESLLRSANANIGAARAAFFPSVSLTGSAGFLSAQADRLFEEDSQTWLFLPRINMPIFTGGRNKARLELAELRKDSRIADYEGAIQKAFREVSDALISNQKLYRQLQIQKRALAAAWKAFNISKTRYETGVDNYLQQLDSLRSLYGTQVSFINRQLAYFTNLTGLYKALGGGVY